jgi:hypothetical protein
VQKRPTSQIVLAASAIAAGLLLNPWLLGSCLSPKGYLVPTTHSLILGIDVCLVIFGIGLYLQPQLVWRTLLALTSFAIAWVPLEFMSAALLRRSKPIQAQKVCSGCPFLEADSELGIRAKPGARISISGQLNGHTAYNAQYSIDDHGFRITPVRRGTPKRSHLVFLGCSYTFGESVNDDETLPYFVTKHLDEAVPYNFGIPGYGPQQALHIMRGSISDRIEQSTGMAFYTFIDHHVNRATGMLNVYDSWAAHFPYYEATDSGQVVYRGTFFSGRPLQSFLYGKLARSYFFSLLDWPPIALLDTELGTSLGINNLRTTFAIIEATADAYLKKFPAGKFNVVIFPGERRYADAIRAHFQGKRLTILDYSSRFNPTENNRMLQGDPHPVPNVYEEVALFIRQDLLRRSTSNEGEHGD